MLDLGIAALPRLKHNLALMNDTGIKRFSSFEGRRRHVNWVLMREYSKS